MLKDSLTAFVIGAGAVENGWSPVIRAVRPSLRMPVTPDGANSYFARLVYLLRYYATASSADVRAFLPEHLEYLSHLKSEIARELLQAQKTGEIRARPELRSIINAFLINYSRRFLFVSTNWDTCVDDLARDYIRSLGPGELKTLHVHGIANEPDSLFLPSEVSREPYKQEPKQLEFAQLQMSLWQGLENATRVVLYGISLSPLDAELTQNLAAGLSSPKLREVIVVNPDHALVAHRAATLLDDRYSVRLIGYHPAALTKAFDYSFERDPMPPPSDGVRGA